jgi:hypothetical protein
MDEDPHKPRDVFHTITSDDWRRSIAIGRARANKAWEQIKAKIDESKAAKAMGKPGGSETDSHTERQCDPPHETETRRRPNGHDSTNLSP